MSWLRRSRSTGDVGPSAGTPAEEGDAAEESAGSGTEDDAGRQEQEAAEAAEEDRSRNGPFDVSEVDDDVARVDLGAVQIPPRDGMELRLELDDKSERVIAVTITLAGSSVQIQPFAAPRTQGVWDDIRSEIAAQVTRQGGTADELPGRFGRELLARIPTRTPDGRTGHQVVRFTGVDGPRWFLRAVFNGPAAVDTDAAADLEQVVRGTVVVRGGEAMAPRDLLPLRVPTVPADGDAAAAAKSGTADEEAAPTSRRDGLGPLRRGPEITEIH